MCARKPGFVSTYPAFFAKLKLKKTNLWYAIFTAIDQSSVYNVNASFKTLQLIFLNNSCTRSSAPKNITTMFSM
jgi:putative effector of murein hydrolase